MKEIIEKLKQDGTMFTINGITDWNDSPKVFKIYICKDTSDRGYDITSVEECDRVYPRSMNVKKYTPTGMVVYDYDMFGQRTSFKIKFKDVTIIEKSIKE